MILNESKDVDSRIVFLIVHLAFFDGRFHDNQSCVRSFGCFHFTCLALLLSSLRFCPPFALSKLTEETLQILLPPHDRANDFVLTFFDDTPSHTGQFSRVRMVAEPYR